jgi:hypothetical protein
LAALTRLPASEIELVSIEPVDWPSSLLGCPRPGGVAGAPVITPGYRIILAARGELYEYHTDREGWVVLCRPALTSPSPTATLTTTTSLFDGFSGLFE